MKNKRLYLRPNAELIYLHAPVVLTTPSGGDYSNMDNDEYVVDGNGTWQNSDF